MKSGQHRMIVTAFLAALILMTVQWAYAYPEWTEETQAKYDALVAEIEELREAIAVCDDYIASVDSGDKKAADAAKEKLSAYDDISVPDGLTGDILLQYINTIRTLKSELLTSKLLILTDYVRWTLEAYTKAVKNEQRLKDEVSDLISGKKTYPINSTSKYLADAERTIPEDVFTTLASENGKANTVYFVEGTVIEPLEMENLQVPTYKVLIQDHIVQVSNLVGFAIESGYGEVFQQLEPNAQYVFPPIGETANFYLTYIGFSQVTQLPGFYLGAHESFVGSNK